MIFIAITTVSSVIIKKINKHYRISFMLSSFSVNDTISFEMMISESFLFLFSNLYGQIFFNELVRFLKLSRREGSSCRISVGVSWYESRRLGKGEKRGASFSTYLSLSPSFSSSLFLRSSALNVSYSVSFSLSFCLCRSRPTDIARGRGIRERERQVSSGVPPRHTKAPGERERAPR